MSSDPQITLSLLLPAYQEAENLQVILPRVSSALDSLGVPWEAIVIDTMEPRDNTREICERMGVTHVPRRGGDYYGDAIRTGIETSRGQFVAIMDTDGSHDPEFIRTMWEHRDDADIVIASRYVSGGATENPWMLVAFSKLLNAVFSSVVRLPASDVSNSLRLYRGDSLRAIRLTSSHFDIQEEILARLLWDHEPPATIREVPFHFQARQFGESKRSMPTFIAAFIKAMFHLRSLKRSVRTGRSER